MSPIDLAATIAGTALVLAPINPKAARALTAATPEPEPAPVAPAFDEALIARVRTALGLPTWRPRVELGETETRICLWSQLELNALYESVGGIVASQQVERASDGATWTVEEITVTIDVPDVGPVQAVTDWCDDLAKYGSRDELPLTRALTVPTPEILETVPARGQLLGYTRFAIAPGAPLPDGRIIATVEDPRGSSWRVTDDHGTVHWLHKYGSLVRYTSGVVAFIEPEWAGWASD